jgi:hypothetical protein
MSADRMSRRSLWQVFRAPLVVAAISLSGLIGALLIDGPADLLWSAAVALPLAVIVVLAPRRRP